MARLVHLAVVALLLAAAAPALAGRDFYDILGLSRGASDKDIKRSYRKLAMTYHPDRVQGSDEEKQQAAKRFADISNAYDVLSNAEKKQIYDRHGEEGLKQQEGQQGRQQQGGMFDFFFGGNQGQGQEEEDSKRGHDVYVELPVTLKDLYTGRELRVTRDKSVIKPAAGTRKCNCKQKLVTRQVGPGMFQQFTQHVCEECPNVQLERDSEELTVRVEPGMRDGQQISFFEEGEPMIDGDPGDLKFFIRTAYDARWVRNGDDLLINETISLVDALTGFSRDIHHLDGHVVTLSSDAVVKPGWKQEYPGEGMPKTGQEHKRGTLHVTYSVDFPDVVTPEQAEAIRKMFGGAGASSGQA
jgi:DnaJ family protein B protein 11